ncbi:MAG TPA: acetylornithine transaminase [Gammaproteobacteria bacterium]|jgi:acetylornithine/N-succinyldiaminopimelate aminotransferase
MESPFSAVMPVTPRPEVIFARGEGSWLEDRNGRRYLDFVQGWAVNALGHSPQVVVDALCHQAGLLLNPGPGFYNTPMLRLARTLVERSAFDEVFFSNSGAEANEGAIKLARKWGALHKQGAHGFVTMENGFHGRTLATMSATGKPQWETLYEPKVPGFTRVPYNDLEAVARAIDDNTVAVMLELVQGEGGVVPASREFVQGLRALTRERSCLLIVDEVQTGIGRTGTLFAYQQYGIEPDILTLGKGLGGGVPLAALLTKKRFSCFDYGDQGGTFNGNPLVCAAGLAVVETVGKPAFLQRVRERADDLRTQLQALARRHGLGEVRGSGLLLALPIGALPAAAIVKAAFARRLLVNAPRADVLRFMPALNVSQAEIDEMIGRLDGAITEVKQGGSDDGASG